MPDDPKQMSRAELAKFLDLKIDDGLQQIVNGLLGRGMSARATARLSGVSLHTVNAMQRRMKEGPCR